MADPCIASSARRYHALLLRLIPFSVALCSAARTGTQQVEFDLPPGKAEAALKQFSEQSGLEVLFPTDAVAEIRTNRVKGEMTARQALDAMLAGTALIAVEGRSTSAFTVMRREHDGNSPKNVPQNAPPPPDGGERDSKKKVKP